MKKNAKLNHHTNMLLRDSKPKCTVWITSGGSKCKSTDKSPSEMDFIRKLQDRSPTEWSLFDHFIKPVKSNINGCVKTYLKQDFQLNHVYGIMTEVLMALSKYFFSSQDSPSPQCLFISTVQIVKTQRSYLKSLNIFFFNFFFVCFIISFLYWFS